MKKNTHMQHTYTMLKHTITVCLSYLFPSFLTNTFTFTLNIRDIHNIRTKPNHPVLTTNTCCVGEVTGLRDQGIKINRGENTTQ